jgi:N6-adenosine-specific RNA methylase IME4
MSDQGWKSEFEMKTGRHDLPVAVRLDQIDVGFRLRELDLDKVAALKSSIEQIGLRTPISATGPADKSFDDPDFRVRLTAGAHRLEAIRQLGREHIAVIVNDEDDLDSELWEIDENLIRAELKPADKALFTFRRKEIYLMRHPETDHGGDRASRQVGDLKQGDSKRFTVATAQATGQSERAVQRDAERGEKISEKALRMLRGTRHDKGTILDKLKGLRTEEQEVYVNALFDADKVVGSEYKVIRSDKMATKRAIRTGMINAIAAHGKLVAGEMPRAAFPVGYADPPWEQEAWSNETGQDKGLMYPPMPLDEIKALCAGDRSPFTPDSILYLWVPSNRMDDGIAVLRAWGFEFVSVITWDKEDIGMGRWVRDQTEHLLIGKRGDFPGLLEGSQPRSLYREKKTTHSRKPVWFAEMIDRLYPDMRKIELFQRRASLSEGDIRLNGSWEFWGFEAGTASEALPTGGDPVDGEGPPDQGLHDTNEQAEPNKPKAKKSQKAVKPSAYELEKQASAARKDAYRASITVTPEEGLDTLVLVAQGKVQAYDAAARLGDFAGMRLAYDHLDAICEHIFGLEAGFDWSRGGGPPKGSGRFSCLYDASKWLAGVTAAADGAVPLLGQAGRFLIEVEGCRIDLHCGGLFGLGFGAHVVDLDRPFISETGYRSLGIRLFGDEQAVTEAAGSDMKTFMERACLEELTEGGRKKLKLHNPPFGLSSGPKQPRSDESIRNGRGGDRAYQPGGYLHALITTAVEREVAA